METVLKEYSELPMSKKKIVLGTIHLRRRHFVKREGEVKNLPKNTSKKKPTEGVGVTNRENFRSS